MKRRTRQAVAKNDARWKYTHRKRTSFLSDHKDEVEDMLSQNMRPHEIAKVLKAKHGLSETALSAKQVSDWISNRKKKSKIKTPTVKGNLINADWNDSCM